MEPIPVPVKDVSVFPYLANVPIEVPPVLTGAAGTYSVGTLATWVFYNLRLHGGKPEGEIQLGATYYAVATLEDGKRFTTHWMYATGKGGEPEFGLTQNMIRPEEIAPQSASAPPYLVLAEVDDVVASQSFPPPAIGTIEVILGGKGQLISTRTGTPHLMGFAVTGGKRSTLLHTGMEGINVRARRVKDNEQIGYSNLVCVDAGPTAIFLQDFPGKR